MIEMNDLKMQIYVLTYFNHNFNFFKLMIV